MEFTQNIGLAIHWGIRHKATPEMLQDAQYFLFLACQKYDPQKHQMAFSTYANYWMQNALRKKASLPTEEIPSNLSTHPTNDSHILIAKLTSILPAQQRFIINARLQNYSYKEIAQILKITPRQVNHLYEQAIKKMRQHAKR